MRPFFRAQPPSLQPTPDTPSPPINPLPSRYPPNPLSLSAIFLTFRCMSLNTKKSGNKELQKLKTSLLHSIRNCMHTYLTYPRSRCTAVLGKNVCESTLSYCTSSYFAIVTIFNSCRLVLSAVDTRVVKTSIGFRRPQTNQQIHPTRRGGATENVSHASQQPSSGCTNDALGHTARRTS